MGDHTRMDYDYFGKPKDHEQLGEPSKDYALSGQIMLSAIVVLFAVVLFMVTLHIYARWYLLRVRRRNLQLRRHRRQRPTHIVFYVDPNSSTLAAPASGLDPSVISSLPVFVYSSGTHACALECAVCLSEFEENENGRLLPKCQHCFHIDCIDMWFQSHSTCPICRSPVDPALPVSAPTNNQNDGAVSVSESTGTDSGSGSESGSTSLADRRKDLDQVGVRIQMPEKNDLEDESRLNSPATPVSRTPGTRMLSLKRILSMNRKVPTVSPASGIGTSCSNTVTESDLELGTDELTQADTRAQSPR